jgi:hypothetical protein
MSFFSDLKELLVIVYKLISLKCPYYYFAEKIGLKYKNVRADAEEHNCKRNQRQKYFVNTVKVKLLEERFYTYPASACNVYK